MNDMHGTHITVSRMQSEVACVTSELLESISCQDKLAADLVDITLERDAASLDACKASSQLQLMEHRLEEAICMHAAELEALQNSEAKAAEGADCFRGMLDHPGRIECMPRTCSGICHCLPRRILLIRSR